MKRQLQDQARQMRLEGLAIKEIEKALGVSRSSVSLWVRNIQLNDEQKAQFKTRQRYFDSKKPGASTNSERFRNLRRLFQEEGRKRAKENNLLHLAGCMLYWAEGAKTKNKFSESRNRARRTPERIIGAGRTVPPPAPAACENGRSAAAPG